MIENDGFSLKTIEDWMLKLQKERESKKIF